VAPAGKGAAPTLVLGVRAALTRGPAKLVDLARRVCTARVQTGISRLSRLIEREAKTLLVVVWGREGGIWVLAGGGRRRPVVLVAPAPVERGHRSLRDRVLGPPRKGQPGSEKKTVYREHSLSEECRSRPAIWSSAGRLHWTLP
jgi:hypothetical protein